MPISNTSPQPQDVIIFQRSDDNTYWGEVHISGSDLLFYIDANGHINVDKSASFYTLFPPVSVASGSQGSTNLITGSTVPITSSWAISASWSPGSTSGTTLFTASTYPITSSWTQTASLVNVLFTQSNQNMYIPYVVSTGSQQLWIDSSSIYYNPGTDTLQVNNITASAFTGSHFGTSSWAINTINGGSGTTLFTGSTYPITASWALFSKSASIASPVYGNTVIVDQINGVATGSRNGTPFNNLTQAKNTAISGDLIIVYPGTYAENNLVKDGVNWYFHEGAIVNYTGSKNGSGSVNQYLGIFDDRLTGPANYSVGGFGQFVLNSQDNTASLGTFVNTNSSSTVIWKGQSVAYAHFPGSEASLGARAALHGKHGTIFAEFDTIYDAGLNLRFDSGQLDDIDFTPITYAPNATNIYWELGDMFVKFRYMSKASGYMIWGNQQAGNIDGYNLYYEGDLMDGAGGATGQTTHQSTIYFDAPSPGSGQGGTYNWKSWGNVKEIRNCVINLFQIGRHYITAEKISVVNSLFSIPLGAQVWITAQKITSQMPWITVNDDSRVFVDCQQFEASGSSGIFAGFLTQNSSSYLDVRGNYASLSGSALPIVRNINGGTTIFRGMTLDASQNNAPVFLLDGSGVQIENCKLSASLSQLSISGSVAASLINHGSSTNRPIASNVTVLGQGIYFDGTGSAVSASSILSVGNVVAPSFTGSLQGTSSVSLVAVAGGTQLATGSTVPITSSWALNGGGSNLITGSTIPITSSYSLTSSFLSGSQITGSHFGTSSFATTASFAVTSSFTNGNSKVGLCLPIITVPSNNLSANTTYYFGADAITAANTGYLSASIDIPQNGTIKGFYAKARVTTTGTSEPVTHSLFINNATAVALPSAVYSSSVVDIRSTTLNQVVNQSDTITFRIQTPSVWATPPLTVRWVGYIYIE